MQNQISWHVELDVLPGKFERFRELTSEMVDAAREETGALGFTRFVSDSNQVVHIIERYLDSDSAAAHVRTFRLRFHGRFDGLVRRKRFAVYGSPSAELKELLDHYGATYYELLDGFSR